MPKFLQYRNPTIPQSSNTTVPNDSSLGKRGGRSYATTPPPSGFTWRLSYSGRCRIRTDRRQIYQLPTTRNKTFQCGRQGKHKTKIKHQKNYNSKPCLPINCPRVKVSGKTYVINLHSSLLYLFQMLAIAVCTYAAFSLSSVSEPLFSTT